MGKMKSIRTSANNGNSIYLLVKKNIDNPYYLDVIYYHIRKALIIKNFNLEDVETIKISGKYLGYDIEVDLNYSYYDIISSLSLALSLKAFILSKKYIKGVYDDKLLFGTISSKFLSWECHKAIMELQDDEDFSLIYKMIVEYIDNRSIPEELIESFKETTIDPGFHHLEDFCKKLARRDDYNGKTVIKNNAFLYNGMEEFVVKKIVDYVGNTAFAYCNNLKKISFEGKVLFGKFPIIENPNLRKIVVPTDLVAYYRERLPFYKNIITDNEGCANEDVVNPSVVEPVIESKPELIEETIETSSENQETLRNYNDNSDVEIVYVGVPSADPYTEVELEEELEKVSENTEFKKEKKLIDIKKFETVFEKKATSYKYFWLMAIISLAKEKNSLDLSYKDITIRMAAMAWPVIFEYEIDLGSRDMMHKYLNTISKNTSLIPAATSRVVESYLAQHYTSQGIDKILAPLMRNVPYRFLSPWIKFTTTEEVIEASLKDNFDGLYALHTNGITLSKEWWDYIDSNYIEIRDFILRSFVAYAKDYNNQLKLLKLMTVGTER